MKNKTVRVPEMMELTKIKPHPENPRFIRDEKYQKLVRSLKEFPEMTSVRPLVLNEKMEVLGGNMRLRAMREAGWSQTMVHVVDWPEEKQLEFMIKDNASFGQWDFDILANQWDLNELEEWGVDVYLPEEPDPEKDYGKNNKEIDVDALDSDMTIRLVYTEAEHNLVKGALLKIAATPEAAVYKLLNL